MKDVILLTIIMMKNAQSNTKKTNTKPISKFFTFFVFLFVYVYLSSIFGYISYQAINSLILFNKHEIFLNICFIGVLGYSFFQAIFTSLNLLFFSKDLESLLPLPIKPYKIIMAKFNCLVISQYIIYSVSILPALIVYGYLLKCSILYNIYAILILLIFPIIPVVIISLLLTIIMKFTNIVKNKETVQYITVFFSILIIFFVQFLASTENKDITNEELANKLVEVNNNMENYLFFLPNVSTAIYTLENYSNLEGTKNFCIFVFENILVYVATGLIISRFYIKTVNSIMTNGIKSKKININNSTYKKNKIYKTYILKEIRNLVRNPIFFMQCVVPPFIFPLIFLVPSIIALKKQEKEFYFLMEYLKGYMDSTIGLIVVIEILYLFYIFNFATITSISRDGSDAKVMKYIPLQLDKQLEYKTVLGILFNIVPLIYIVTILKFGLNFNNLMLIYIVVLGILINIFNNFLVIIVDLKNPKTDWMTEYAVVKQNLNMFYQMIILVIQMGILLFSLKINNPNLCFTILSIAFIILIVVIKKFIKSNKQELFKKIY